MKRTESPPAPPLFVKRARALRTENTPLSAVDSYLAAASHQTGGNDDDGDGDFLATGIKEGQAVIQAAGFDDYQREDGKPGPVGATGSGDNYNVDYMREYARRLVSVSQDPNFAFAYEVLGFLNGDVFEILDKDAFQREVEREVARAREDVRKQLTRAESVDSLRKTIAALEEQLKITTGQLNGLEKLDNAWETARTQYAAARLQVDPLVADNVALYTAPSVTKYREVATKRGIDKAEKQLFDMMARTAFRNYGASGLLAAGFASDIEKSFRTYCTKTFFVGANAPLYVDLVKQIPLVVEVALYLAALKAFSSARGFLEEIAATLPFADGSEYKKNARQFGVDAFVLAQLLMPDDDVGQAAGPATFTSVSLVLLSHLNAMIPRSGRSDDERIAKPGAKDAVVQGAGGAKRTKKILGYEVDVNVDDERLQRAAIGDKTVFTEEELAAYKKQLFVNAETEKTMLAVSRLLRPLFVEGFGKMFFVSGDASAAAYEESRYPTDRPQLVRSVYQLDELTPAVAGVSIANIVPFALYLLARSAKSPLPYKIESLFSNMRFDAVWANEQIGAFVAQLIQEYEAPDAWRRYEVALRDALVRRRLLPLIARLLDLMNGRIDTGDAEALLFSDEDTAALGAYLTNTEKAPPATVAQVLRLFDNGLPKALAQGEVPPNGVNLYTSNAVFDKILDERGKLSVGNERKNLGNERVTIEQRLTQFRTKLHTVLTRTPEEERREIESNLGVADVSRRWASLPFNSGMLVLSHRFRSCLSDSTGLVRRQVPGMARWSSEAMQRDPQTHTDFAKLVATKILIVNATNPGQYLRDGTIPDLRVQLRDCIESLRAAHTARDSCRGFGTPVTSSVASTGGRQAVPLRNFGQFFV